MVKVGIVGGTGYTGVELLRLVCQHPHAELIAITSRKETGMPVADLFSSLRGRTSLHFTEPTSESIKQCDVVFFATPHGIAMNQAEALLESGVRVIDLAADFRLKDPIEFEAWYKLAHRCPELLKESVYGLPELNRELIRPARLVGMPGCYPTAVQLGFLPVLEYGGLIDTASLIADCKSGVSGAGRKAELGILYAESSDSLKAYSITGHRHWPEIKQGLRAIASAAGKAQGANDLKITFVPHLTPMIRGIHATLYARVLNHAQEFDFQHLYEERYAHEPFIDVLPKGSHPETRSVRASNFVRVAVHRPPDSDLLVILVVEDNLVKGASGQAIQVMNLMFGLPETAGLSQIPVLP